MARAAVTLSRAYQSLVPGGANDGQRFVLVEGPRGTGKTRAVLSLMAMRVLATPGMRVLLARSTRTRLSQSVLETLEQQVLPALGLPVPGGDAENRRVYRFPGGGAMVPLGLDDQERTQSVEVGGVYLAEATELPRREDALALAASLRQRGIANPQIVMDANPVHPGHWLNQWAEPVAPELRRVVTREDYLRLQRHNDAPAPAGHIKRIITRHQDNPAYWDAERWCPRPEGAEYTTTLEHYTGHQRRRWLDGDWVSAEGAVFREFDELRHVIRRFDVPPDWPWWVGVDPGYDHPCAVLWLTAAPNGTIYVADELYRGGLPISRHAQDIHARNTGRTVRAYLADPQHAFSRTAQSPRTIAEQFGDHGLTFQGWPRSSDVHAMVEAVRRKLIDGKLRFFDSCTETIREMQSWSYKRRADGSLPAGDDAYEDRDNHAIDVLKGLVAHGLAHSPGRIEVCVG